MKIFEIIGKKIIDALMFLGHLYSFFFKTVIAIFKPPFSLNEIFSQIVKIGYNSIPVVLITAFFTGMVLALQSGHMLDTKIDRVSKLMGGLVATSMVRELGPVLTGLIVTGKTGSSMAAEIGTMKVTEQIDALRTLATDPIQYLAVPRFLASIVMLPALTLIADIVGILGGAVITVFTLNHTLSDFMEYMQNYVGMGDVIGGVIKASVFGAIISIVSCAYGFATSGGAEGVGKSTTSAVVISSMGILISDYFLTELLTM